MRNLRSFAVSAAQDDMHSALIIRRRAALCRPPRDGFSRAADRRPLRRHPLSRSWPLPAGHHLLPRADEVFYPPQWLIWLPSFHFGFQLHILLHFVIAAIGMVALLRGLGARSLAATFGAAVFVMSG